ncbi:MAG: hypothetical protein K2Q26_04925 [Bdellovibrionales bacterium]|nr:hypothetical protein [Bdellovibrionales bacterium]
MSGYFKVLILLMGLVFIQQSLAQPVPTSPHPMRPTETPAPGTPGSATDPATTTSPEANKGAIVRDGDKGSLQDRRRKNPALLKKTTDPMGNASGPDPEHGTDGSTQKPTRPGSK